MKRLHRAMLDAITHSLVANAEQWQCETNTFDSGIWALRLGTIEIEQCCGLSLTVAGQKTRIGLWGAWRLRKAIRDRAAIIASNELERAIEAIGAAR